MSTPRTSEQANADFERARGKALMRGVASWLTRRSNALLRFDDVRQRLHAEGQHHGGSHEVPIDRIVGSVGRYRDFDRVFLPRQRGTKERWTSIDRAQIEDVSLPPVELYRLGDVYFVKDGNHRVSVARERGQEFVDARVIVISTPVPVHSVDDLERWLANQDAVTFLADTGLARLRPGAAIMLTVPDGYATLLEHVSGHRWFLGIERQRDVAYEEAVVSWYDSVYLPLVGIIRECGVLRDFPHRTEADLYLWIVEHRWFLLQAGEARADESLESVVRRYARAYSPRPAKRLARLVRKPRH